MAPPNRDVLISGASVAGPVLAHWLRHYGFNPTLVEHTPSVRTGLGGHAVDLFGASVDVVERMGVLPHVLGARTRTELILFERDGQPPIALNMGEVATGMSIRHVEILRGELTKILSGAASDGVGYLFGDSIRRLDDDGDGVNVTFETADPRRFGLVVGADGLHSNVRRLVFGDEARFMKYIGGYFAVFTLPNYLELDGRMVVYNRPGRVVGMYPVHQSGEARAVFLFRRAEPLVYDHRDRDEQKKLLREAFADFGWEAPRLLAELDDAEDLYFDSISQIITDTWSRGRVTLVGDAGYSPRPGRRRRHDDRGSRRVRARRGVVSDRWGAGRRASRLRGQNAGLCPAQPQVRPNERQAPDPGDTDARPASARGHAVDAEASGPGPAAGSGLACRSVRVVCAGGLRSRPCPNLTTSTSTFPDSPTNPPGLRSGLT